MELVMYFNSNGILSQDFIDSKNPESGLASAKRVWKFVESQNIHSPLVVILLRAQLRDTNVTIVQFPVEKNNTEIPRQRASHLARQYGINE